MRYCKFLSLAFTIRKLSKEHDEWDKVYRTYLLCIRLILIVSILRYITECILVVALLITAFHVLSHPVVLNAIATNPMYRWMNSVLQFSNIQERSFLP